MLEFDTVPLTTDMWSQYLKQIQLSNWMQTWPYANALHKRDFKKPQTVVIKLNQQPVGICLFFEIKLGPIHLIEIQRGPLWFQQSISQYGLLELTKHFCEKFNEIYPRRYLRRRRWLPELEQNQQLHELIQSFGFKIRSETFSTVWLNIVPNIDVLRIQLEQKWRNGLNKAEKLNLDIRVDRDQKNIDLFVQNYQKYKIDKNYAGLSPLFVLEELKLALKLKSCFLVWSYQGDLPIAGLMVSLHGHCASYRASWNSEQGRSLNSHYALIWKAVVELKQIGIQYFDLGGLIHDEKTNRNYFKLGLGGVTQHNINMLS